MQLIEQDLPAAGKDDLGVGGIENWLIAQVARREAEEMLKEDAELQQHDLNKTN